MKWINLLTKKFRRFFLHEIAFSLVPHCYFAQKQKQTRPKPRYSHR